MRLSILTCVLAAFLLTTAAGCHREGSAQKAGQKIDDAVDQLRK